MKRSDGRILTTHIGSLPRPADLYEMLKAREEGKPVDDAGFRKQLRDDVAGIVRKQRELGIDVVDDGEFSKMSFINYVSDRLDGFEPDTERVVRWAWVGSREDIAFPDFYFEAKQGKRQPRLVCTGPIKYKGQSDLARDLDNLKAALSAANVAEAFMPAISPSNIEEWHRNAYYKSSEEYLFAIGEAMRDEYRAIVDAGFLLQIDDPRLVSYWVLHPELSVEEMRRWAEIKVEALNHALRGIPEDRIRHHTCYGINIGPRSSELELRHIADIILKIRAGAYSFEASNPRHEHEWAVWRDVKLPDGKLLIPGVVSNSTVLVEHSELVAQRIERFAGVVGRENVIAGTDCGFATSAASREMPPSVIWAKLQALGEGAAIASKRLWK